MTTYANLRSEAQGFITDWLDARDWPKGTVEALAGLARADDKPRLTGWHHDPAPHNPDIWTLHGREFDAYVWARGEGRWSGNVDPSGHRFHNVDIHATAADAMAAVDAHVEAIINGDAS